MTELISVSDAEEAGHPYLEFQNLFDAVHYIDDFLYICDLVSVTIGIPLNLVVIGAILLLKRFHLQRNFIWIGIGTSNIIILASHLTADLFVRLGSSASARALSIWFVALSTATQTVNILYINSFSWKNGKLPKIYFISKREKKKYVYISGVNPGTYKI